MHEAREQVAFAEGGQPRRRERLQAPVDVDAQPGERAERRVVAGQPLGVAQQRPRQREELDAGDRDRERRRPGLLGRARDQPRRRRGQSDCRARRAGAERGRQRERPGGDSDQRPHAAAAVGVERDDAVGERDQGRPVRDQHDRPPAHEPADGADHLRFGRAVEAGGRLIEQQQRGVAQERARERDALALAGREAGAAVAQPGVEAVRERVRHARVGQRPPDRLGRRVRPAHAHVVGHRAREQMRPLGHPGNAGVPRLRRQIAEIDAAYADAARVRRRQAQEHVQQRRLPGPAGPRDREHLARRHGQRQPVECRGVASRIRDAQSFDDDRVRGRVGHDRPRSARRGRRVEHVEDLLRGRGALGSGVVARSQPAQRKVGLRREHQHEQRGLEADVAAQQPQADRDRDERHRDRGQQLQDQRGKEREPQRGQRALAVASGDGLDRGRLRLRPAEHLQRREAGDDVEEVAAQPVQDAHLLVGALAGRGAHQRHEQRDQRHRHDDDCRRYPIPGHEHGQHRRGHDEREDELREVLREEPVERVDAARGQRRPAAGRSALAGEQRGPELGLGARRAAGGGRRCEPRSGRPGDDHDQQRYKRAVGRRVAGECTGNDVREQPRLDDQQDRRRDAERDGGRDRGPR